MTRFQFLPRLQSLPWSPRGQSRLAMQRHHDGMTWLAALFGRIAATGLHSPAARMGSMVTLRLSAAGLGLALVAGLVPFAFELSRHPASMEAALLRDDGAMETSTPPQRREGPAPKLPLFDPGPAANWSKVVRPIAIFGVPSPELAGLPQRYESLRNAKGGRDDRVMFGEFAASRPATGSAGQALLREPAPHAHLSFVRMADQTGKEQASTQTAIRPFYIALARMAAEQGLGVERAQQPTMLTTKFGMVEVADVAMIQGETMRACLAFRHESSATFFQLGGWWCGTAARPADRRQLACMIDRIDLLSAGEDRDLRSLFATAEKARDPACTASRLASVGRKPTWLDPETSAPGLRVSHQSSVKR